MRLAPLSLVVLLALVSWAGGQITEGQWTYIVENGGATIAASTATGAVTIPSVLGGYAVKNVGTWAWTPVFGYDNTSVTSVAIPDSVTSIGYGAFRRCTGLTSVSIPDSVTSIAFGTLDTTLPWVFDGCINLERIDIDPGNPAYSSVGGVVFNKFATSLLRVPPGKQGHYAVPASVVSIADWAFVQCSKLTGISIPITVASTGALDFGYIFEGGEDITYLTAPPITVDVTSLADNEDFVTALAAKILASQPNNYGIATKADLSGAISDATTQAIAQVQASPNDYNLFSSTQYQANRITGVAEGKAEVTSNPTAYSLFTESSIMDMNLGGVMLKKGSNANALDLELTIETKDNLATSGWQVAERISRSVSMAGVQRQFLRVRAGAPYVAPDVKVLAHPTLGNILTDGAGRVLYYFAADTPGGNPLFSGSSWPYVTVPAAPKADAGVTAMLASSTFGKPGGPYLTVNGRPVYFYVGDTIAGQANGQGVGSVWWTVKADGAINQ